MKNKYIAIIALAILAVAVISYAQLQKKPQKSSLSNANQTNNIKINMNPYVEPDNSPSASTLAELQKDNIVSHPNWQTYLDPIQGNK
jgi:hypothetical protein